MNTTVLTPVRLWQDYDAESCALEPSFLTYEKRDDLTYFEAYITAFTEADGKARAFEEQLRGQGTPVEAHYFEGLGHPLFRYREPLGGVFYEIRKITDGFLINNSRFTIHN